MAPEARRGLADFVERIGRRTVAGVEELGFAAALFSESLYWLGFGFRRNQPVRLPAIFAEMMDIGIRALPILTVLSATIGIMLAIQGIHTLKTFGAEQQVVIGIALSVVREFAPLITGILVAGRSGSALAARLSTMTISQEVDALRVMGVSPVRMLVVPSLLAAVVMLPALSLYSMVVAQIASCGWVSADLGMAPSIYYERTMDFLKVDDVEHGLVKALLFGIAITLIAAVNGASVVGGAEGVGRSTTRTVVQSIAAILITDMVFVYLTTN